MGGYLENVTRHSLHGDGHDGLLDIAFLAVRGGLHIEAAFLLLFNKNFPAGEDAVLVLIARVQAEQDRLDGIRVEICAGDIPVHGNKELGFAFLEGNVGGQSGKCLNLESLGIRTLVEEHAFADVGRFGDGVSHVWVPHSQLRGESHGEQLEADIAQQDIGDGGFDIGGFTLNKENFLRLVVQLRGDSSLPDDDVIRHCGNNRRRGRDCDHNGNRRAGIFDDLFGWTLWCGNVRRLAEHCAEYALRYLCLLQPDEFIRIQAEHGGRRLDFGEDGVLVESGANHSDNGVVCEDLGFCGRGGLGRLCHGWF